MTTVLAVHPGEILLEEFLVPLGMTPYALARAIGVSQTRIGEILKRKRAVTAGTALRLAAFFGTSTELWMSLQGNWDIQRSRKALGPVLLEPPQALHDLTVVPEDERKRLLSRDPRRGARHELRDHGHVDPGETLGRVEDAPQRGLHARAGLEVVMPGTRDLRRAEGFELVEHRLPFVARASCPCSCVESVECREHLCHGAAPEGLALG